MIAGYCRIVGSNGGAITPSFETQLEMPNDMSG